MAQEIKTEKADFKHIIRVANVDIPGEKKLGSALTKIKGIGFNFAHAICTVAGVNKYLRAGDLNDEQIKALNNVAKDFAGIPPWMFNHNKDYETGENKHYLTGTLGFVKDNDIKRLKMIRCYKGIRHGKGLTVRGQRTKSNFRLNKGKVVGVVKKAVKPGEEGPKKEAAGGKK
ncbi:30S ribosomal protein S13, partial [Candidatus Woesearchaeota archaeon]|nr:30S ribosomal protein S13 [Candidatus Woesearchaeota archaeon]